MRTRSSWFSSLHCKMVVVLAASLVVLSAVATGPTALGAQQPGAPAPATTAADPKDVASQDAIISAL